MWGCGSHWCTLCLTTQSEAACDGRSGLVAGGMSISDTLRDSLTHAVLDCRGQLSRAQDGTSLCASQHVNPSDKQHVWVPGVAWCVIGLWSRKQHADTVVAGQRHDVLSVLGRPPLFSSCTSHLRGGWVGKQVPSIHSQPYLPCVMSHTWLLQLPNSACLLWHPHSQVVAALDAWGATVRAELCRSVTTVDVLVPSYRVDPDTLASILACVR